MSGRVMRAEGPEADSPLDHARTVFRMEADALHRASQNLDAGFSRAVELMAGAERVIVSGVGKSGLVARKIAATLTSTGTPATFLHPVDALHGDLGIVSERDVALLLSKGGESEEMMGLLTHLGRIGAHVVAITGNHASTLGRHAEVVLDGSVGEEACPLDLAPTCSTTVAMAMGDALAVALLRARGFERSDFARLHPGGSLGRKLLLRIADVMIDHDLPALSAEATMRECTLLLAEKRGTVAVVDADGRLIGVVTSGDLTRLMEREEHFLGYSIAEVMTPDPKSGSPGDLAASAAGVMERHGVMCLPVIDEDRKLVGMVHLHDLMRAGAV